MRTDIPTALLEHFQAEATSIAICWSIEKNNGEFIRGTEHDQDIMIDPTGDSPESDLVGFYPAGANIRTSTLRSAAEMAPDTMDVDGAMPVVVDYIDVTVADIEAGLLDQAAVQVFAVNWQAPNDGQFIIRRGFLGDIARDSDGKYSTEIRGLAQLLSQQFIETYGVRCMVKRFGDERCKLDLTPYTHTGTVISVTSRREFVTDLSLSPLPDFRGGEFRFDTGLNATYMREAKNAATDGTFTFWDVFPEDVSPGDTFTVIEACNRSRERCLELGNMVNFRGYGIFTPGLDAMTKGPT